MLGKFEVRCDLPDTYSALTWSVMLHVLMLLLMNAYWLILLVLHPFRRCTKLHLLHLVARTRSIIAIPLSKFVLDAALDHICYRSRLHLWPIVCQCRELVHVKSERERHGCHALVVFLLTRGACIINFLHLDVIRSISSALAVGSRCKCRVVFCPAISVVEYDMGWGLEYFLKDSFG